VVTMGFLVNVSAAYQEAQKLGIRIGTTVTRRSSDSL